MSTTPSSGASSLLEEAPPVSAPGLAALLCAVSFAAVAFMLCIFRLLSFFIMPSLFFHLLFIGFPLGAFIGARWFKASVRDFGRSLAILQVVMLASVGVCLLCKYAGYLRAQMYHLDVVTLFKQIGWFTAMFLPFFCAYGLSEYIGYQLGRSTLKSRMRAVYAVYLFGAALAYLAVRFGIGGLGITRIMVLAVALVVGAHALIATRRRWLLAEVGALLLVSLPNLDDGFFRLYKGRYEVMTSTKAMQAEGFVPIYQRWGRYALCEMMESTEDGRVCGFYNDALQWWYDRPWGVEMPSLDTLPFLLVPDGGRVVIVGSGGGRQVRWATTQHHLAEIVAVELEPEVFAGTRGVHAEKFNKVYEVPGVTPVRAEGRTYLTAADEPFDLVFMPSVGGYPQMMLEPGNMIRTAEAYALMAERLTPTGVIAVWYPKGLDSEDYTLTKQYVDTLRSIGLHTTWYENRNDVLIIASPEESQSKLPAERTNALLEGRSGPFGRAVNPDFHPREVPYPGNPEFKPITDEKPFLAGNVATIFTMEMVHKVFGLLFGGLAVVGVAAALWLRRRGDPRVPGLSYAALVPVSLLIGANFLVMEHALVIALFRRSFVYYDSLTLGAVAFLFLTGVGSMFIAGKLLRPAYALGALSPLAMLAFSGSVPPFVLVLLMLPSILTIGSFFPLLFDLARRNPLAVFAMDSIGAALASMLTFYIPITMGLSRIVPVAAALQIATLAAIVVVLRRTRTAPG